MVYPILKEKMLIYDKQHAIEIFIYLLPLLLFPTLNFSQSFEPFYLSGTNNSTELSSPFAGGLNAPQFSQVDLDDNGTRDLYVFDREGDVHLTFLAMEENGTIGYHFAPRFAKNFPVCTEWVLLRDFNGDDIQDLFTYSGLEGINGIRVFKGKYVNDKIAFDRIALENGFEFNVLTWKNGSAPSEIPISDIDYPAIEDMDGDGDLDILTYEPTGKHVYLFDNQAIENNFPLDSLIFTLADDCWGRFSEQVNGTTINLGTNIDACPEWNTPNIHPGSTLLPFDENGDGLMDILIGDNSSSFLTKLTNGGNAETAFMIAKDTIFPSYDISAKIDLFISSFLIDIDQDGKKDLITSPNLNGISEDAQLAWFYKNTGSNDDFIFEFQQSDFLVEDMFDFGTNSTSAFADVNGDGLVDLVVGNHSFYVSPLDKDPRLFLLENTGTATAPIFSLVDDNWLNFQQFENYTTDFSPAFGDLDGDGDADLLVGEKFGSVFFVENHGGAGNPMVFDIITHHWQDIDVGQAATPQIADLNRDDLPDLLIGERKGKLVFFPNQGTASNPQFHPDPDVLPNNPFFGEIETNEPGTFTGHSFPFLYDLDTSFLLLTGSLSGKINLYQFTEEQLDEPLIPLSEYWGDMKVGLNTRPILYDLNQDGVLEVIIGNQRGGLSAFLSNINVDGTTEVLEQKETSNVRVFPNPVKDVLFIQLNDLSSIKEKILLYNGLGEQVRIFNKSPLFLGDLANGIYFLKIGTKTYRFLKL